ncbi:MAG TPA: heavy metal-binding domain-containing protein [Chitinophagaceae bacterium]|nr:heavy metal-binding domain-containing protein [Chitinophagaceae bacterium]
MKHLLKTAMAIVAMSSVTFFIACNNGEKKPQTEVASSETEEHKHSYRCPMNCEKGKTYDKEGNCPICGMKLEHFDGVDNGLTYKMQYVSNPTQLEAGKSATLSFTPKVVGKDNEAVPLDVQHEKKIHLIVVSNDLSYFEHIHPDYHPDGAYKIEVLEKGKPYTNGAGKTETYFNSGGDYTLFADYLPSGGSHQVEKISINVKGSPKPAVSYNTEKLVSKSDNFTVTLTPLSTKLVTGSVMQIAGKVTKDGKEIDPNTLENYLGAKAHIVVISVNDKEYLHVHPEVNNGKFDIQTTFKKPGIYKAWIQFQSEGKVHTVDFILDVKEGSVNNQ